MSSKQSAEQASSEILNKEYDLLRARRKKSLAFRYGHLLNKNLIMAGGSDPEIINKAIRYSHSKWQVLLAAFVWLGASLCLIYINGNINVAILFIVILGGGFAVTRLIRHYINVYLSAYKQNA